MFLIFQNQIDHNENQEQIIQDLQGQLEVKRGVISQLEEERDQEKKSRVSFEMKLVEYDEYKKEAEANMVSIRGA